MNKEDGQIAWKNGIGHYNKKKLFEICWFPFDEGFVLYLLLRIYPIKLASYTTLRAAKRGAKRVLKCLQEITK